MTNEKLAWLAGLWDGEGTITVFKHQDESDKYWKLRPTCCVSNTDPNIVTEILKLGDEMGIHYALFTTTPKKKQHAAAYQLNLRKMSSIKILLEAILPYLIGKKSQAELTLRFVESRMKHMRGTNEERAYTEEEESLSKQLYKLNAKGQTRILRDYTLDTPKSEDIVRTNGKPLEVDSKSLR